MRHPATPSHAAGFTLLELLVVLVIIGMTLGMVSLAIMPDSRKTLETDAQRIALLLQLARDEAIVRNRPVAFEAGAERYRFLVREDAGWTVLQDDELLHERAFRLAPVQLQIVPKIAPENGNQATPLRIVFGREPVDQAFVLTISAGTDSAAIRADGIGHFALQ